MSDQDYIAQLEQGLEAVEALIDESFGVAGLHRNGDVAPWDSLRREGGFATWLTPFDDALAAKRARACARS